MPERRGAGRIVDAFLTSLDEARRAELEPLIALIRKTVPKLEPVTYGKMLGFGPFHYRYASGREGDATLVAVANGKAQISLYVLAADEHGYLAEQFAPRLGKVSCGKSCIRFKRFADLDAGALRTLLKTAEKLGGASAML